MDEERRREGGGGVRREGEEEGGGGRESKVVEHELHAYLCTEVVDSCWREASSTESC